MSQGPDKIFLLITAQWEIYFKTGKLFLRIPFISLLIPDPEMGHLSSCAAKGIFKKSLDNCKVTDLPLGALTRARQGSESISFLACFAVSLFFIH